ncbi:MAG: hypothetical protein B7Z31_07110, partial [Rhodobacterales bacterium 12-65-15]
MKFTYKSKRTQPLRFLSEALAVLLVLALVALVRPAAAGALDLTMAAALDKVYTLHTNDAEDRFLGSAFLWGDGSVVVTNAHVVGDRDEVRLIDRYGVE